MSLRPGMRLRGAADATEVVVVHAPSEDVDLRCGGHPMIAIDAEGAAQPPLDQGFADGTQLGKRYIDTGTGLELLSTKPGEGTLSIGATPLTLKAAKPLPSSD